MKSALHETFCIFLDEISTNEFKLVFDKPFVGRLLLVYKRDKDNKLIAQLLVDGDEFYGMY